MRLPTVHINGTSRNSLITSHRAAMHAVSSALHAMTDCMPHGRDFYPRGQAAIEEAMEEYRARARKLRSVLDDLQAIVEHLSDQIAE